MRTILTTFFLLLSFQLHAESLKLAIITSEFDKNFTEFYIITNEENEIDSLRYVTILPNGGISEDVTLPAEEVMKDGAVIVARNGHEAVRLGLENFTLKLGGVIKLNYLYSGITNTWHVKRIKLALEEAKFKLYDGQGNHINRMFVKVNWSRFFGIIGVKDIQTSLEAYGISTN